MIHEKSGAGKTGNAVIDISEDTQAICEKLDLVPAEVAMLTIARGVAAVEFVTGERQTFAVKA